ncbi:MAG: S8 family serine peptidase, partial [Isosphaeraceae bacterium]
MRQARPRLEWLEDRRLLSSDLKGSALLDATNKALIAAGEKSSALSPTIDRGDSYVADGSVISLLRRTDRIAVLVGGDAGRDSTRGLSSVRTLDNGVQVFDLGVAPGVNVDAAIADVGARAGVSWAAPVFYYAQSDSEMVLADETIVALAPGVKAESFFASQKSVASYRPLVGTPDQFVAVLNVGAGVPTLQATATLNSAKGVRWASPNFYMDLKKFYTPNDPLFSRQWHLNNTGQAGGIVGADVKATEAWNLTQGGSPSIVVAVVDDGMEYTHPDLAPNLFVNAGEIAGNGVDDDGNGWIDDVNGWDFTSAGIGDNDPGPSTTADAHATSVAGVAAGAGDNALGTTGMAYKSKILPVRIFLGGTATSTANIASAVYYAAGRTANGLGTWNAGSVMNNSWGGGAANAAITAAFTWATTNGRGGKGVVTFISSGNSGAATVAYPANLSTTNTGIIAVGAVDATDRWAYSQYGTGLDVVAPSDGNTLNSSTFFMDGIVTTDRQGGNGYNGAAGMNGDYTTTAESGFGGTSSASPLTAGIGALMLALDGNLTAAQVKQLLRNTTDLVGGATYTSGNPAIPWNTQYGYGRVNAYSALAGIATRAIGLQTDTNDLPNGTGIAAFSAAVGASQDRRIFIRNEGTMPINFTAPTLSAGTAFSIVTPPPVTTLGLGETTSFVVRFTPTTTGPVSQTASMTTDVAGAATFTINLNGTGNTATQVTGKVFHDIDASGTFTASDAALAGVPVYVDQNNNGMFDQSVNTFNSVQVPRMVTLGGFVGSGVVVSGVTGVLTDLNVTMTVSQTGTAGLYLYLTAPNGIRIPLASHLTGINASYTNTVFDDQAANPIGSGSVPYTGTFRPIVPLANFASLNPNGTWVLQVAGANASTSTTITSWSVQVSASTEKFTLTDASGNFTFGQLPTGANNVRVAVPAGLVPTNPNPALWVVNLPLNNSVAAGTDFAMQLANAVYGSVYHDQNANASQQPGEQLVSGWMLYNDANDNGMLDVGVAYPSTDVPKNLPDNTTVNSMTTVAGVVGNI